MKEKIKNIYDKWNRLRSTSGFHDVVLFLIFVIVSAVFWFILALNDSAQDNFNVRLHIENKPDSVTFISDIPERIHATVSDKGTNLWRNGFMKDPTVAIDFKEYSADGVLRYSYSDLLSSLKGAFGSNAVISALSIDSLRLVYTTNPGKKIPVVIESEVYPALGYTLEGRPKAQPSEVSVYGENNVIDTIHLVPTERIELRDLTETKKLMVSMRKIKNVRIIPSSVEVTIPIEPLVRKESMITITPMNVPAGESLLIFPSKVPVEYYVAMSRLGDDDDSSIELLVDYNNVKETTTGKMKVEISKFPERLKNLTLKSDSVEYAIVKD